VSDPEGRNFDAVDRLVRAHLDREAERTDATVLRSRIQDGVPHFVRAGVVPTRVGRSVKRLSGPWSRSLVWSMATAACVLVIGAIFGGRSLSPVTANAATLLRNVRVVHSHGVDRRYRVHYAPDPRYWDRSKTIEGPSESVLWTRGDRFWSDCSIGNLRLAIGRDEDGTLWVSPSRKKGIRFASDDSQWPKEVAVLCDINSLTVPKLMDDVLADFNLRAEGPSSHSGEPTSLVWARLRPGRSHPLISAALLEIDARSDVLLRLVIWIVREGRPNGTVTYTLLDSSNQGDEQYRLTSHLDPDAEVEHHRFGRGRVDDVKAGK
jgi:hypothetical protein